MLAGNVSKLFIAIFVLALLGGCGRERTSTTDVTLEASDKIFMNEVFFKALNEAISENRHEWYNDATGNAGAIVLDSTYLNNASLYCRRFREEVEIPRGAIPKWFDGRACKNKSGVWVRQ